RQGRVDAISGALFALAAWTKPNVIGLAAGAVADEIVAGRARSLQPTAAAPGLGGSLPRGAPWLGGGAGVEHLTRSTMQSAHVLRAMEQVALRFPLLGIPHLFVAYCGFKSRKDPRVRLVLTALCASLAWTMVSMGKVGSSTNYWLEPSVAAVLLLAFA